MTGQQAKMMIDWEGNRLEFSQKFYGRQNELQVMLSAYDDVCSCSKQSTTNATTSTTNQSMPIILVSGYSGVGKSALVQEFEKQISVRTSRERKVRNNHPNNTNDDDTIKPYNFLLGKFQDPSQRTRPF